MEPTSAVASTPPPVYQLPAPNGFSPTGPPPAAATPKANGPSPTARADTKTYPAAMASIPSGQQPQAAPSALPPGWIEMKDPSGRDIFVNTATGQSSWQRPIVRRLPPGWQKSQTPDGKVIFIHPESGRSSYEWPAAQSHGSDFAGAAPPTQEVSPPLQPIGYSPGDRPPYQGRSQSTPSYRPQGGSLMTANVEGALATKVAHGGQEAYTINQLSENHNCNVLSKALVHDIGVTSSAIKDTTVIAASLAVRQAKTVTKTVMNPTKMRKMSKKMVVHTGALGVKTGRACKGLIHEMVDAADKKGRYQPKQHQFMPNGTQPLQGPQRVFRIDQHGQSQMHPLSQAPPIPQNLVNEYEYAQPPSNIPIQYQTNWLPQAIAPPPNLATQQPQGIPSSTFQVHGKSGLNFNPGVPARKALKHQAQRPESSNSSALEATIPAPAGMIISGGDVAGPAAARGNAPARSWTMGDVSTYQVMNQKANPQQISGSIAGPGKATPPNQADAIGNSTSFAHPVRRATTGVQSSPQVQGPLQSVQSVNRGPTNTPPDLSNPPAFQQNMGQISSPRQVRPSIRPSMTHPPAHQPSPSISMHPQLTTTRPPSNLLPSCEQAVPTELRHPSGNRPAAIPSPGTQPPAPLAHPHHTSAPVSHVPHSHPHSRPHAQPTPPVTDNSELGAYQQNSYGDGTQQNDYGDGTQQSNYGDGTQQNNYGDGTQQNDYVDETQQNNYGDGTQQNDYGDGTQQSSYGDGTQQNDMNSSATIMDQQSQVDYIQVDTSNMLDASGADQATLVDQNANQQQTASQDQDVGGGQDLVGDDNTCYQGMDQVDGAGQMNGGDQSGDAAGYGAYTEQMVVADDGVGSQAMYCQETGAVQFADGSGYEYDYSCEVDVSGDTYTSDDYSGDIYDGGDYGIDTYSGDDFGGGDCY